MAAPVADPRRDPPWGRRAWFSVIAVLITGAVATFVVLAKSGHDAAEPLAGRPVPSDRVLSKAAVDVADARPMGPRLSDDTVLWLATRGGHTEIWAARSSGAGAHRLVALEDVGSPVLSHDRRTIAYLRDSAAYLIGTDGHGRRPLFTINRSSCAFASRPAFDGDDTSVAVLCASGGNRRDLYVVDLDGSYRTKTPLVSGNIGDISFGVGGQIAFWQACGGDERKARLAMIAATAAPGTTPTALSGCIGANDPSFSPDGKSLAFTVWTGSSADIYVESLATRRPRRLTTDPLPDQAPTWSPDGTRIAYKHGPSRNADIWVVTVADAKTRALTRDTVPDTVPSWYTR